MGSRKKATTRSGWRQWKPEQAREELERWRASGLPLGTYARSQGVTPQRLAWWRERLGEGVTPPAPPWEGGAARLVPMNVTSVRPTPRPTTAPLVTVTVRLPGDVTLEVSDVGAVPPEWVAAVAWKLSRAG
jgi:hypothetical protein